MKLDRYGNTKNEQVANILLEVVSFLKQYPDSILNEGVKDWFKKKQPSETSTHNESPLYKELLTTPELIAEYKKAVAYDKELYHFMDIKNLKSSADLVSKAKGATTIDSSPVSKVLYEDYRIPESIYSKKLKPFEYSDGDYKCIASDGTVWELNHEYLWDKDASASELKTKGCKQINKSVKEYYDEVIVD